MASKINFFNEGELTLIPFRKGKCRDIALDIFESNNKSLKYINVILCDDEYLLNINKTYLNHDYLTDIITFDDGEEKVGSDIFISLDRIRDNATRLNIESTTEFMRVFIHGCLHLCGLKDKSLPDQKKMRSQEDYYLIKSGFEIKNPVKS